MSKWIENDCYTDVTCVSYSAHCKHEILLLSLYVLAVRYICFSGRSSKEMYVSLRIWVVRVFDLSFSVAKKIERCMSLGVYDAYTMNLCRCFHRYDASH